MAVATVTELKTYLNKATTADDTELQTFIDRAQATLEKRVGPMEAVTVTDEDHDCPKSMVLPRVMPVVSVESVTTYPGAIVIPPRDVVADTDGYRLDGWDIYYSFPSNVTVRISYTAGRENVSADLKQAVLELAAHDWRTTQTKRPGSSITGQPDQTDAARITPHLLPYRVEELIAYDLLPPKVA